MRKEPQLIRLDFDTNSESASVAISHVPKTWRIFISNLKLDGLIGIYPSEKIQPQPIIVNVSAIYRASVPYEGNSDSVVCYQQLVKKIQKRVCERHISYVENLAEEIATLCLDDSRVSEVTVRVEKPDAITEAASVGVEITRHRTNDSISLIN
jgi:dihydroneopterin aldolase